MIKWIVKQDLLCAWFCKVLMVSAAFPSTHKVVISRVSETLLGGEKIVTAIATLVAVTLYQRYREIVWKRFKIFLTVEMAVYSAVITAEILGIVDPQDYFVADFLTSATVTRLLVCGANRIRTTLYRDTRERFDNLKEVVGALAAVAGGALGSFGIPLQAGWALLGIGLIMDDLFIWRAYNKAVQKNR